MIDYALVRRATGHVSCVRGGIFEKRSAKIADLKAVPAGTGAAGRDAEHERNRAGLRGIAQALKDNRRFFSESLILAQNERWQRGLGMQVERDRGCSNVPP